MTSTPSTSFVYAAKLMTTTPLPVADGDFNDTHHGAPGKPQVTLCDCLSRLEQSCLRSREPIPVSMLNYNSDLGRMMYSLAIIGMFSMIILLLMVRSIKRSNSTIEVEALLDAMRFREELDLQQRQKRRLQKAKSKVTAWLTKTNGKLWTSSPQIILPNNGATSSANGKVQTAQKKPVPKNTRNDSMQSSGSFLPEIVISNSEDMYNRRQNSCTPSLSLLYDFDLRSRKNSAYTELSETIDLSQISDLSFSNELDPHCIAASPQPLGSQYSLNVVGQSSI
uniref:Uncharacterized protein n=1 Tax=Bursaphelenchus xylophilus TaxID=6326 RepID=A0A1I7SRJ1_BURXY